VVPNKGPTCEVPHTSCDVGMRTAKAVCTCGIGGETREIRISSETRFEVRREGT